MSENFKEKIINIPIVKPRDTDDNIYDYKDIFLFENKTDSEEINENNFIIEMEPAVVEKEKPRFAISHTLSKNI